MYGRNDIWGAPLEMHAEVQEDQDNILTDERFSASDLDRAAYQSPPEEVKRSWLLSPPQSIIERRRRRRLYAYMNSAWVRSSLLLTLIGAIVFHIVKFAPHHRHRPPPSPDNYTNALHKALMFFNAQRSGRLPKDNNVSWRGNSCLKDGQLVGGYYDAGDATKHNFPTAFAMTMLSWSVLEYSEKYVAAQELDHVKGIIKWGTEYLLNTFDSSANSADKIASYVGDTKGNCWMRPEEIDRDRPASECHTCPALAAETSAALAAASIVFKDSVNYSKKLVHGADILFKFATNNQGFEYSGGEDPSMPKYNSTGYWDEFLWGGTWLFLATGEPSYLKLVTAAQEIHSSKRGSERYVLSWDNKLPGAFLLLTRVRMFLSYGYPYEEMLRKFHNHTDNIMCSYLPDFHTFNRTKAGLVLLNHGRPQPLQYVVNAAFLATLYADYMETIFVHGLYCGPKFCGREVLREFAKTQINYILGKNPESMSYVAGFGDRYPLHVHHAGASIPSDKRKYGCKGWKWMNSKKPNPNVIVGAMVGGPDKFDGFRDVRSNSNYTEPSLAGNAGLVAALVALSGTTTGIDKNTIFHAVPPLFTAP